MASNELIKILSGNLTRKSCYIILRLEIFLNKNKTTFIQPFTMFVSRGQFVNKFKTKITKFNLWPLIISYIVLQKIILVDIF
jgi:hypothetical protein